MVVASARDVSPPKLASYRNSQSGGISPSERDFFNLDRHDEPRHIRSGTKMSSVSRGGFVPFNEHHSIVSCSATLAFSAQQVFVPDFQKGIRRATRALDLPISAPSYGVQVSFDSMKIFLGVNRPLESTSPPVGVEFSRSADDGKLTWRHQALPGVIVVQTFDYLRWKPFFNEVCRFVEAIRHLYNLDALQSVKLEYLDRFSCRWSGQPPDAWEVLKSGSRYMNPSIHDGAHLWHSHVGERYPLANDSVFPRGKRERQRDVRIETIDDIYPDGQTSRNITVLTSVHDFLPGSFAAGKDAMECVNHTLETQHDGLKIMLGEILNDGACDRINLHES